MTKRTTVDLTSMQALQNAREAKARAYAAEAPDDQFRSLASALMPACHAAYNEFAHHGAKFPDIDAGELVDAYAAAAADILGFAVANAILNGARADILEFAKHNFLIRFGQSVATVIGLRAETEGHRPIRPVS